MDLAGYSATGPRDVNEDSFFSAELADGTELSRGVRALAVVSDGMGGYQGGDIASNIVITGAEHYFSQLVEMVDGNAVDLDAAAALEEMANRAHAAILEAARADGGRSMGATFVGAFVSPSHAWIGHVGDSRAYLVHDGEAIQLTEDHSQVGRMLSRGIITEEEAQNHPERNKIEQALGFTVMAVDINECDFSEGDALVLMSDGVYTGVKAHEIGEIVSRSTSAAAAAKALVKAAISNGTDDNSTALVVFPGAASKGEGRSKPSTLSEGDKLRAPDPLDDTGAKKPLHAAKITIAKPEEPVTEVLGENPIEPTRVMAAQRASAQKAASQRVRVQSSKTQAARRRTAAGSRRSSGTSRGKSAGGFNQALVIPIAVAALLVALVIWLLASSANQASSGGSAPAGTQGQSAPAATGAPDEQGSSTLAPTPSAEASAPELEAPGAAEQSAEASVYVDPDEPAADSSVVTVGTGEDAIIRYINSAGVATRFSMTFPELDDDGAEPAMRAGDEIEVEGDASSFNSPVGLMYQKVYSYPYRGLVDDLRKRAEGQDLIPRSSFRLMTGYASDEQYENFLDVLLSHYNNDPDLVAQEVTGLLVVVPVGSEPALTSADTTSTDATNAPDLSTTVTTGTTGDTGTAGDTGTTGDAGTSMQGMAGTADGPQG